METIINEGDKKTSKLAVFVFVLSVLNIIAILFSGFIYDSLALFAVSTVINIFFIWLTFYTKKRAIKKNLLGKKLASFAFYAFVVIFVLDIISAVVLSSYANKLKEFAITQTPNFFDEQLAGFKINSTPELNKVLSYEATSNDIYLKFSEAGNIKECLQEEFDINQVAYGFSFDRNILKLKLEGNYSVRCYGENKPFDFQAIVEYKSNKWLIKDYIFNLDINKDFDIQNISK